MKTVESTAYHEAGHSAAAIYLGLGVKHVSIIPGGEYAGFVKLNRQPSFSRLDSDDSAQLTQRAEKNMMVLLAGIEAQRKFSPHSVRRHHPQGDYKTVYQFATSLCGSDEETFALVNLLQIRTKNILQIDYVWNGVVALAKALIQRQELKGKEARAIFEAASMEN